MPCFSIIVRSYKRPLTLATAIRSILDQTFQDFEIVVVDDCSEDQEIKHVVASFGDSRIKYFENPQNMGPAYSLNYGVRESSGNLITFLDDDDLFFPSFLERTLQHLSDTNVDFCWCGIEHFRQGP